jgi:hypothetical protein
MRITHVLWRKSRFLSGERMTGTMLEREYLTVVPPPTYAVVVETFKRDAVLRYRDADYLVFELR